jgi:hypothetical protein
MPKTMPRTKDFEIMSAEDVPEQRARIINHKKIRDYLWECVNDADYDEFAIVCAGSEVAHKIAQNLRVRRAREDGAVPPCRIRLQNSVVYVKPE